MRDSDEERCPVPFRCRHHLWGDLTKFCWSFKSIYSSVSRSTDLLLHLSFLALPPILFIRLTSTSNLQHLLFTSFTCISFHYLFHAIFLVLNLICLSFLAAFLSAPLFSSSTLHLPNLPLVLTFLPNVFPPSIHLSHHFTQLFLLFCSFL